MAFLNVSIIEDNISVGDIEANLAQLETNLQRLPDDTDLVILPELFSTGFIINDRDRMLQLSESNTGATITRLENIAVKYNIALAGSFLAHTAGRIYNRGFMIEPSGDSNFYDKYHLFSIGGEREIFAQGISQPQVIRYRGWNLMPVICYDIRFPVWCRNNGNKYDALIVVANWPESRIYSWKSLLVARAIENECYVCAANRIGNDESGIKYSGSSMAIDFRGKIIKERSSSPIIHASLDKNALESFRKNFPAWQDSDDFTLHGF